MPKEEPVGATTTVRKCSLANQESFQKNTTNTTTQEESKPRIVDSLQTIIGDTQIEVPAEQTRATEPRTPTTTLQLPRTTLQSPRTPVNTLQSPRIPDASPVGAGASTNYTTSNHLFRN